MYYTVDEEDSEAKYQALGTHDKVLAGEATIQCKIQLTDAFLTSWDCCEGQEKQDLHGFQVRASKELLQRRSEGLSTTSEKLHSGGFVC